MEATELQSESNKPTGVDGLEDEGPAFDKALPEHALAETNPVIEGLLNIGGGIVGYCIHFST